MASEKHQDSQKQVIIGEYHGDPSGPNFISNIIGRLPRVVTPYLLIERDRQRLQILQIEASLGK
jgi:hypothetical protein